MSIHYVWPDRTSSFSLFFSPFCLIAPPNVKTTTARLQDGFYPLESAVLGQPKLVLEKRIDK